MTPLQLEPSAHAPWMRTMFGRAFISGSLRGRVLRPSCGARPRPGYPQHDCTLRTPRRGQRGDTVSPGHLLDAEARQGHLVSVRKSAGGDPEHDRTSSDVQSGSGYLREGPCSVVRRSRQPERATAAIRDRRCPSAEVDVHDGDRLSRASPSRDTTQPAILGGTVTAAIPADLLDRLQRPFYGNPSAVLTYLSRRVGGSAGR